MTTSDLHTTSARSDSVAWVRDRAGVGPLDQLPQLSQTIWTASKQLGPTINEQQPFFLLFASPDHT